MAVVAVTKIMRHDRKERTETRIIVTIAGYRIFGA